MKNKSKFFQSKIHRIKADTNQGAKANILPIVYITTTAGKLSALTQRLKALFIAAGRPSFSYSILTPNKLPVLPDTASVGTR